MTNSAWFKRIALAVLALFVLWGIFFFPHQATAPHEITYAEARVFFPEHDEAILTAQISDTVEKRTLGLSNRKDLPEDRGMFFIFNNEGTYGFWMKDMNFAIDILWFDAGLQLVDMWQNATPDSYPKIVEPKTPAKYVLEVPAGFAKKYSLVIGDTLYMHTGD